MIEVKNLVKTFGRANAVDNISFSIASGDVFGFIGPNGAGKTTTIKMLTTLLDPTSGSITIDGVSVVDYPEEVRRIIGYMPDDYGVYTGIRVDEYLNFFAAAYKIPRSRRNAICNDVMELTDLTGIRWKMVSSLSRGMRQRLCLARSLLHDPKVLVLDEPASGLDPRARIEFRELIKELRSMGKTILISSHILTELSDICTTVGIIERGSLLLSGKVSDILNQIGSGKQIIIKVDGDSRTRSKALDLLSTHESVEMVLEDGDTLRLTVTREDVPNMEFIKLLIAHDISVASIHEEKQDLEKLFMRVTRGDLA